ncbi:MAG: mRNA-decapping enzyme subunit 2 [Claussenomyces sp. TS43310]|nr:MAG: mRNA-decapping enzyme subunit 2 [Claussenomyces sp. TS43310]
MQLEDWLDDLCVRFIINLPEEDLSSVARICFQVEEAQWFYEDFIRPLDPTLPSMSLRSFCLRIFQHCPLLSAFSADNHMRAFEEFLTYKTRVPVRGAIMLNQAMDSVVLVKGWKKGANWSFPRGKINKDEDDLDCAVREVYEETGYDIKEAGLVPKRDEVKYIEITMREQHMRLYVFRDVPMDTRFEPRTRKEISKIQWYRLSDLPAFRKKGQGQHGGEEAAANANKFYMVAPFLVPLKKWVAQQKKKDAQIMLSHQYLTSTNPDDILTEEEQGTDRGYSYMSETTQNNEVTSMPAPGLDIMAGATAALHRMLKIQPPTQGLQPEAASAGPSPVSQNSGEALLALLQSKPQKEVSRPAKQSTLPQTPLDLTMTNPPLPKTPHHQQPRPPRFSSIPSPPSFQLQTSNDLQDDARLYQTQWARDLQHLRDPSVFQDIQQPVQPPEQYQRYQPQQLRHPQPLPPQIPRAVFTEGQVHAPVMRQPFPQVPTPLAKETTSMQLSRPQFPNAHGPLLSPATKSTPPKLTSHSLALLNAFKSKDQVTASNSYEGHLPIPRTTQDTAPEQSQGPMKETSQNRIVDIPEMSGIGISSPHAGPREPVSNEQHRSSLLDMFKGANVKSISSSVSSTAAGPLTPQMENTTPGLERQEQPATIPPFPNSATRGLSNKGESQPLLKPEHKLENLPFNPVAILSRPLIEVGSSKRSGSTARAHGEGLISVVSQPRVGTVESPIASEVAAQGTSAAKPIQRQILKRPQVPQQRGMTMPAELAAPSPPVLSTTSVTKPSLDRRDSQSAEQRLALLSLFSKPPAASSSSIEPRIASQTPERLRGFDASDLGRSTASSIASARGDVTSELPRRSGQNPTSPANKGFLLGYLNAVADNDR